MTNHMIQQTNEQNKDRKMDTQISSTERSLLSRFLSSQFKKLPYPSQDFRHLVVIVTGANTGLGLEACRHFVRLGAAKVILAVRDVEKGKAAQESILKSTNVTNKTEVWSLDLASLESVKTFAQRAESLERLDVVVANGGLCTERFETIEGMEKSFLVNVVSTFLLVLLLLPSLRKTASELKTRPRVVIVSSEGHETATFDERKSTSIFAALNDESKSNMGDRYDTTKLLQLYAMRALSVRLNQSGKPPVTLNAITPGLCRTSLLRESSPIAQILIGVIKLAIARSAEMGSRTIVNAAMATEDTHGEYLRDCEITRPASFVESAEGEKTQERFFLELIEALERISPGVIANI